ncbi:hypothetical protein ABPG74_011569 [Tetrahymena malaccensis]
MSDYDFVIKFKKSMDKDNQSSLTKSLEFSGFEVKFFPENQTEQEFCKEEKMLFVKYRDYTYLLKKAEELQLQKRMLDQYLEEEYSNKDSSVEKKKATTSKEQYAKLLQEEEFRNKKVQKFIGIRVELPDLVKRMEKYRKFKYSIKHKFSKQESDSEIFNIFTPSEQLMIKQSIIMNIVFNQENLIESYREKGLIHNPIPLHQKSQKPEKMTVSDIRNYFGDNISIYFAFVEFFQKQLLPLVGIGILIGILNNFFDYDSKTSPFDSIYSAIVILWGSFFFATWKKHEKQIKVQSCSQSQKQLKKTQKMLVSQEEASLFIPKIDYVTGQKDLHFPFKRRLVRYIIGGIKLFPFITAAILFLIVSLNIRGYVDPDHEFLFIKVLYDQSQAGGFFDKSVGWRKLLATILHVNIFQKLNGFYRAVAEETCKKELHSTHVKKNNSLVLKRFLFEMLYTFTDLSYIAFVRFDIEALKRELIAIYSADEIRRVVTESVIPYFTKLKYRKQQEAQQQKLVKKTDEQEMQLQYFKDVMLELQLPKYEPFDDYLEIVINFGYITLFAAAFPFAPLLVFIFNAIELYSDKHKIYYLYQRPHAFKISGIGIWNQILSFISIFCVLTNIILFSFSSDQITRFFPSLFFDQAPQEEQVLFMAPPPLEGQGRYLVFVVFVIEHLLFISIYLLRKFILTRSDWTMIYQQRKEYYKKIRYIPQQEN